MTAAHLELVSVHAPNEVVAMRGNGYLGTIFMATNGDKIARVFGWMKREEVAPVAATVEAWEADKGMRLIKQDGAILTKYRVTIKVTEATNRTLDSVFRRRADSIIRIESIQALTIYVIGGSDLAFVAKNTLPYINAKQNLYHNNNRFDVIAYLSTLAPITNMVQDMERYSDEPDTGVAVKVYSHYDCIPEGFEDLDEPTKNKIDERNQLVMALGNAFGIPAVDGREHPQVEEETLLAYAYCNVFCLIKTGTEVNMKLALTNRLRALKNALKLRNFDAEGFLNNKIDIGQCARIYSDMGLMPRLKSLIFSCILSNDTPFNSHIKLILKEAQLTVFNLIVHFIYAQKVTLLHVLEEISDEFDVFLDAMENLKHRYGKCWPYCKLVNPDETLATLSRFPHLSNAGKAYAFAQGGSESIKNLQGMRAVPTHYFRYSKMTISDEVNVGLVDAAERARAALRRIHPEREFNDITAEILAQKRLAAANVELPEYVTRFLRGDVRE